MATVRFLDKKVPFNLKTIIIISIALIFLNDSAFCENKDKNLSFIRVFSLEKKKETYSLRPVDQQNIYNLYSCYRDALDDTGGIELHLFPNNKFLYLEHCDICTPKMISYGVFNFKNSKINFNYEYIDEKFKNEITKEHLNAFVGFIDKGSYITGLISILLSDKGLKKLKKDGPIFFDYMLKAYDYRDWENIYNKLKKSRGD